MGALNDPHPLRPVEERSWPSRSSPLRDDGEGGRCPRGWKVRCEELEAVAAERLACPRSWGGVWGPILTDGWFERCSYILNSFAKKIG